MLEEAEANYNGLCNIVDKNILELTGLKMERFKVEGLVQELDIRVKVYEMREKELKVSLLLIHSRYDINRIF